MINCFNRIIDAASTTDVTKENWKRTGVLATDVFYRKQSAGDGFAGKLLVKTNGIVKTFSVFTQQIQELSTAIDVSISSQSLESDIAKNLPLNVKFQALATISPKL